MPNGTAEMSFASITQLTAVVGNAPISRAIRILLMGVATPDDGNILLSDVPSSRWSWLQQVDKIGRQTLFCTLKLLIMDLCHAFT